MLGADHRAGRPGSTSSTRPTSPPTSRTARARRALGRAADGAPPTARARCCSPARGLSDSGELQTLAQAVVDRSSLGDHRRGRARRAAYGGRCARSGRCWCAAPARRSAAPTTSSGSCTRSPRDGHDQRFTLRRNAAGADRRGELRGGRRPASRAGGPDMRSRMPRQPRRRRRRRDRFYGKYRGARRRQRRTPRPGPHPGAGARRCSHDVETRLGAAGRAVRRRPASARSRSRRSAPASGSSSRRATSSRPIWTGCWWGDDERPEDESGAQATPPLKIVRTEQGLLVSLDDDGQTIALSRRRTARTSSRSRSSRARSRSRPRRKVVVEAPQIELVENATHPVVFGDDLLQYLNQLVQIYQSTCTPARRRAGIPVTPAPPVPPFPPATPALLSTKVKTG